MTAQLTTNDFLFILHAAKNRSGRAFIVPMGLPRRIKRKLRKSAVNFTVDNINQSIEEFINRVELEEIKGKLVIVEPDRIKIKRS